jgi:enolase
MLTLVNLFARQILDSRATPTLEVVCQLSDGSIGVASVPSGKSVGTYEAHELRDNDPNIYFGKSVLKAISNVNTVISPKLLHQELKNTSEIDSVLISLDSTPNKSSLGANAILGVSMAVTKAIAASRKVPLYRYVAAIAKNAKPLFLPTPIFNMLNGGLHGTGNLDIQEFHIIPIKPATFSKNLELGATIYHTIKDLLARRGSIHSVGDEGGFTPNLFTNLDALALLEESLSSCNLQFKTDIGFGLDVAANSLYRDNLYHIKDQPSPMSAADFMGYLKNLLVKYPLTLLEDPLHEDAWEDWTALTAAVSPGTVTVGDDLLVSNESRLQNAISLKACTALLLKPNQIGTITESINVAQTAKLAGLKVIASHRSGETNDTFIADFAIGIGADYVKFGGPARGERVAKYNRLLAVEHELSSK